MNLNGKFLVLDGPDGCGKSTQIKLLADCLGTHGQQVITCRDPGGTTIGDRIRSVLLDHDLTDMDVRCETLLFMASRAQLLGEIIQPALAGGMVVLGDRFVSSTCAYQGAAGFDVNRVIRLAEFAIDNRWPDLTIVLDIPLETAWQRMGRSAGDSGAKSTAKLDAMERRPDEFHHNVRNLFLKLPDFYPAPVEIINANADRSTVHDRILTSLRSRFA
jgi:dTMP kinase